MPQERNVAAWVRPGSSAAICKPPDDAEVSYSKQRSWAGSGVRVVGLYCDRKQQGMQGMHRMKTSLQVDDAKADKSKQRSWGRRRGSAWWL